MYNDITTEERIDNYLLNRMSEEERRVFETDLEKDAELREEYECQREISNAVQKVAMRNFLAQYVKSRRSKVTVFDHIRDFFRSYAEMVSDFFNSWQRVEWASVSVAFVAVFVVACTSTIDSYQESGERLYAKAEILPSRGGGNEIDSQIEKVYDLIGENELDSALVSIKDMCRLIKEDLSCEMSPEEYEDECKPYLYDLKWYKTIILMKQGKVLSARKALKSIATDPENPYSDFAKNWKKYSKQ